MRNRGDAFIEFRTLLFIPFTYASLYNPFVSQSFNSSLARGYRKGCRSASSRAHLETLAVPLVDDGASAARNASSSSSPPLATTLAVLGDGTGSGRGRRRTDRRSNGAGAGRGGSGTGSGVNDGARGEGGVDGAELDVGELDVGVGDAGLDVGGDARGSRARAALGAGLACAVDGVG